MNHKAEHELFMMIGYMLIGAIMILAMSGGISRLISGSGRQTINSFDTLAKEIALLIADQEDFAQSQVTFTLQGDKLEGGAVLVGFSASFSRYEQLSSLFSGRLIKPDMCSGGCLCLYENSKSWGIAGEQNKQVRCKDFGKGVHFITDMGRGDFNYGELRPEQLPVLSHDANHAGTYNAVALYSQKHNAAANTKNNRDYFNTRVLYIDKQKTADGTFIYFAMYDEQIKAERQAAISP
jgi:hypothetical protein